MAVAMATVGVKGLSDSCAKTLFIVMIHALMSFLADVCGLFDPVEVWFPVSHQSTGPVDNMKREPEISR